MSNKVIFVVLDGLNYQVAQDCMGYLSAFMHSQQATSYQISSELPSLSRPLYECLLTGETPVKSGIVNNQISRLSFNSSVFSLAAQAGLTTAAAAYHWVSELYNSSPFNLQTDRICNDKSRNIQHGIFYHLDDYPDAILFADADHLRQTYQPDFLLIHPMNIDDAGHKFGLDSPEYRNKARQADTILSHHLPTWLAEGYHVVITSDHGMNNDKTHGGSLNEERAVPLFLFGEQFSQQITGVKQTQICGLLCQLLGLNDHQKAYNPALLKQGKIHE